MICQIADDTNITYAASAIADLENVVNSELRKLICWLIINRLSLNVAKTEFMVIELNQGILPSRITKLILRSTGKSIEKVKEAKSFGLVIDEQLSWTRHIDQRRP